MEITFGRFYLPFEKYVKIRPLMDGNEIISELEEKELVVKIRPLMDGNILEQLEDIAEGLKSDH